MEQEDATTHMEDQGEEQQDQENDHSEDEQTRDQAQLPLKYKQFDCNTCTFAGFAHAVTPEYVSVPTPPSIDSKKLGDYVLEKCILPKLRSLGYLNPCIHNGYSKAINDLPDNSFDKMLTKNIQAKLSVNKCVIQGRQCFLYCKNCLNWDANTPRPELHACVIASVKFRREPSAWIFTELYPHNQACESPNSPLGVRDKVDRELNGSGLMRKPIDFDVIFGSTYNAIIEKSMSYGNPCNNGPPGLWLNNGMVDEEGNDDHYPWDNRFYCALPSPTFYPDELSSEAHRAAMLRFSLWFMNTFSLVWEFYPRSNTDSTVLLNKPGFQRDWNPLQYPEPSPNGPDKSIQVITMIGGGHALEPIYDSNGKLKRSLGGRGFYYQVKPVRDPSKAVHQPCHQDFPPYFPPEGPDPTEGADPLEGLPLHHNPRLKGIFKPGTIIVPIQDSRKIYHISPHQEVITVNRGEVLYFSGDYKHGGMVYLVDSGEPLSWHLSLHMHLMSTFHQHEEGHLTYHINFDTYCPNEHIDYVMGNVGCDFVRMAKENARVFERLYNGPSQEAQDILSRMLSKLRVSTIDNQNQALPSSRTSSPSTDEDTTQDTNSVSVAIRVGDHRRVVGRMASRMFARESAATPTQHDVTESAASPPQCHCPNPNCRVQSGQGTLDSECVECKRLFHVECGAMCDVEYNKKGFVCSLCLDGGAYNVKQAAAPARSPSGKRKRSSSLSTTSSGRDEGGAVDPVTTFEDVREGPFMVGAGNFNKCKKKYQYYFKSHVPPWTEVYCPNIQRTYVLTPLHQAWAKIVTDPYAMEEKVWPALESWGQFGCNVVIRMIENNTDNTNKAKADRAIGHLSAWGNADEEEDEEERISKVKGFWAYYWLPVNTDGFDFFWKIWLRYPNIPKNWSEVDYNCSTYTPCCHIKTLLGVLWDHAPPRVIGLQKFSEDLDLQKFSEELDAAIAEERAAKRSTESVAGLSHDNTVAEDTQPFDFIN